MVCISSCIPRPVSTDATDLAEVQKPAPRSQWVNYGTRTLGNSKAIHQRTCMVGVRSVGCFLDAGLNEAAARVASATCVLFQASPLDPRCGTCAESVRPNFGPTSDLSMYA
jgi:hypothetical protein